MDPTTIFIFVVLLALSAFFSGTEIALMSLPKHKIESLLKQGVKGAEDLKFIKEHSDRLLITILIGNNLVNTYTAAFATTVAMGIAKQSGLGIDQSMAVGIATGVVTLLLLLFGEIAPKSFATKNAEKISLSVAKFYKLLMFLLYPLVIFIEFITGLFTGKSKQEVVSEEEIEAFIDMGKESGTLEVHEHKQIKNLLELDETLVEEVMTPRIKVDKISDESTLDESLDYILSHTHSRIPVYHEDIDHIVGIVNLRFIIESIKKFDGDKKLKDLNLPQPLKVPLTKPVDELLKEFQKNHQQIAIVIDEYGGVAGLITLEDIIEEVFGEIQDETDKEEQQIKKISDNVYEVDSLVLLEDILDSLGIDLEQLSFDTDYSGETLSYFITSYLERFPKSGEKIILDKFNDFKLELVVKNVVDGKIGKVQIKKNNMSGK